MTKATHNEIKVQAEYLKLLAEKILDAAKGLPSDAPYFASSRNNGTIQNLCPELAKNASKLKKMASYGWKTENNKGE